MLLVTTIAAVFGACDSPVTAPATPADAALSLSATTGTLVGPITSQLDAGMCLDVYNKDTANGSDVVLYRCNGGENQQWTWTPAGELKVYGEAKCLDAYYAQGNDGDRVAIHGCNGGENQKWAPTEAGELRGINGKCLDLVASKVTNRAAIAIHSCNGGTNQKWNAPSTGASAPAVPTAEPTLQPAAAAPTARQGVWLSRAEVMALPMSGTAWERIATAARASWGSPNLADNNSTHDTFVLAGALYAARTGDAAITAKTREGIMSVRGSGYARVLELSRNITSYVIAADLVGLEPADDAAFRAFVAGLRTKPLQGHSGAGNMRDNALIVPNNWGAMSRAAMAAIDVYLGDAAGLAATAQAHRAYLGEAVPNRLVYTSTNWHPGGATKVGINRRGATIDGRSVDGVMPEDQRRTGEFAWPAPKGSYPWEALQGTVVTAAILDRAGLVPFHAGDRAIERAVAWLYSTNANPAIGDDTWQPWVMNRIGGMGLPTTSARAGKNMGWTDWTHGSR